MKTLLNPFFGQYGGMYVGEILIPALLQLEKAFVEAKDDPAFRAELNDLMHNYAGRPTPITLCRNITKGTNTRIYLKRGSAPRRRAQDQSGSWPGSPCKKNGQDQNHR